jgi:phosphotransferase system HPr (HPr) family protein
VIPERPLEEVIHEETFGGLLEARSRSFFRLANTLLVRVEWSKTHFYQLHTEADELESFLDDYGARFNRNYALIRELVASVRWFAMAGFSISHLESRYESYGVRASLSRAELAGAQASFQTTRNFVRQGIEALLGELQRECVRLGLPWTGDGFPEGEFNGGGPRQRLPRNVGHEDLIDEDQRIAEVASKYLAACEMLGELRIRRIQDPIDRRERLARICTEERARVYEATVHNLQSIYDTHVKNTVVEGHDERLPKLRGHLSVALHLLEAVTFLTHFVERHEGGQRAQTAEQRIAELVDREAVQDLILNHLLYWADLFLQRGRRVAEELLPTYTNLQELVVELPDDLKLHARPASLIVNIVGHYGTPVELEVRGRRCNAGSILEVLVTVGASADARRFVFRGDENPLRDIALLFEAGLGEHGLDVLPPELSYLRSD